MHGFENSVVSLATSAFSSLGYGGVVLLMAIESCCIPLPSEVILPLAGFLVAQGRFSFWGAVFAGSVGGTIGSAIAYGIGAAGGRPLLLRYGKYILINREDADRADDFFRRHGELTAFFSRLLPVIRTFISLPAGITRMNFPRFILYTFAGSLLWSILLVRVGEALGRNWTEVRSLIQRFDYLIVVIVLALVALYIWRHLSHARRVPLK
ncbi:MAG: DedA family protein [Chloroflexota bacterium]